MKKLLVAITALFTVSLAACGNDSESDGSVLKVGATNVPHAEILEQAKPILAEKGINLEIVKYQDYVLPNKHLAQGELDANYFQHLPYFEQDIADNGYELENAGGIHIEPIGIYSHDFQDLSELPNGATIIMSNSVTDQGRMLSLIEKAGLITLKQGIDITKLTINDIVDNPKNLQFKADIDPGMLVQAYKNNEGDAILINSNYAIDAGLTPTEDAIALEDADSPFVNIVAVRKGDTDREEIKTLIEVLRSEKIQDFILEKYKGAVVPVNQ